MPPALDQRTLKSFIVYDANSGQFYWTRRTPNMFGGRRSAEGSCGTWNTKHAGRNAGSVDCTGRWLIRIKSRPYQAHRLAWLYVYGEWPHGNIDHIDRNPLNNRISNLRIATQSQNSRNITKTIGKSGHRGVCQSGKKWRAYIGVSGKNKNLGTFDDLEAAVAARRNASRQEFGEFSPFFGDPENA